MDASSVLKSLRDVSADSESYLPMPAGYKAGQTKYVVVVDPKHLDEDRISAAPCVIARLFRRQAHGRQQRFEIVARRFGRQRVVSADAGRLQGGADEVRRGRRPQTPG